MTPVEAPRSTDSFLFFDCRDFVFFFILTWLVVALGAVNDFAPSPGVRSHNGIPTASQQQQSAANRSITATGHHWSPLGTSRHILRILNDFKVMEKQSPDRPNLLLLLSLQLLSQLGLHDPLLFLPLCQMRHMMLSKRDKTKLQGELHRTSYFVL